MAHRRDVLAGIAIAPMGAMVSSQLWSIAPAQAATSSMLTLPSWADQMKALMPVADNLIAKWGRPNVTEDERQDMYILALAMLSEGYLCYVYSNPSRPEWMPLWNLAYNQGGPNPDYVYSRADVDSAGVYRISGYRGTSRFVDISQQTQKMLTSLQASLNARKAGAEKNDLDTLKIDKDGYFSVILSAERPAGYTGDWWKLYPGVQWLLMRRCACDWKNEIDARVAIQRMDDAEPPTTEEIAKRFSELPAWVEGMITFDMELVQYYRAHHPTNGLERSKIISQIGGLVNQFYYDGIYEINDDEALVMEATLPRKCRYWQTLVADDRFCTVDWHNRQSSLNDLQARLDSDGKLRTVISKRDPGVPNWLDKADNRWGMIQMRFNEASDDPQPVVTRCKVTDVRKHLPAETPVVTPEQRKAQLWARGEGAQLRHNW